MRIERDDLQQQLEPYYFNSWIVDEVADFILALEPGYQQFVLGWVLSVAKTQPEIGIEDTRMALFEARQRGVHPFCITIDEQARDYLPHMYGDASYVFIDDIAKLPFRISEIYRSLTS